MNQMRPVEALSRVGQCPDPGKAPETLYLTLGQLRINDAYQRSLTQSSQAGIRRMAKNWDWKRYTPISVTPTDEENVYEIPDGQRRALAAASNGNIHILPCYLAPAETLEERAQTFVGVNMGRVGLTTANVYKGLLVAKDETAVAVQAALDANGCRILEMPPAKGLYHVGDTMAVGTLLQVAKTRGGDRLSQLLGIAKASGAAPVSSCLLKALNLAVPILAGKDQDKAVIAITRVVKGQGAARLEMIAKNRTPEGARSFEVLADMLSEMAKLPQKRLGLPSRAKAGWKPRLRQVA